MTNSMANSRDRTKNYWLHEKEKIAEARKAWKKLLDIRDGLVLERKTINTPEGPVEVDVVVSVRDLIKCCVAIMDRAIGKPAQALDLTSAGEKFTVIVNSFDETTGERPEEMRKRANEARGRELPENVQSERTTPE